MRIPLILLATGSLCLAGVMAAGQTPAATANADQPASASCEHLAALQLPNVTITTAKLVAAGTFAGPPKPSPVQICRRFYKKLPAFCRIVAHDKPTDGLRHRD